MKKKNVTLKSQQNFGKRFVKVYMTLVFVCVEKCHIMVENRV